MGGEDYGKGEAYALPELSQNIGEYVRGLGVAELVKAISEQRNAAVGKEMTLHTLDVMTGILKSAESQCWYEIQKKGPEAQIL